eukprot:9476784-Pyramimonas_sp.AAC.1
MRRTQTLVLGLQRLQSLLQLGQGRGFSPNGRGLALGAAARGVDGNHTLEALPLVYLTLEALLIAA